MIFCIISLSKDLEELGISEQILSKYIKNTCKVDKKGLVFKEYKNEYLSISGFWKKDIPYGRWIEKSYTNIIINDRQARHIWLRCKRHPCRPIALLESGCCA